MKRSLFVIASVVALATSLASAEGKAQLKSYKDMTPEERVEHQKRVAAKRLEMTGGLIEKPGTGKGSICFVDAQKRFAGVSDFAARLAAETKFRISAASADPDAFADPSATMKAHGCSLAIFVVDDAKTPAMLVAPEDRWAAVNIAKLEAGLKGSLASKFFDQRCRKELLRTFSLLCGGASSQFPKNFTKVTKVEDLDFVDEFIPVDMPQRYVEYLKEMDVTPIAMSTYVKACLDGWAPQPTNALQKAVWDRVHTLPTKPIVIEPESKKSKK